MKKIEELTTIAHDVTWYIDALLRDFVFAQDKRDDEDEFIDTVQESVVRVRELSDAVAQLVKARTKADLKSSISEVLRCIDCMFDSPYDVRHVFSYDELQHVDSYWELMRACVSLVDLLAEHYGDVCTKTTLRGLTDVSIRLSGRVESNDNLNYLHEMNAKLTRVLNGGQA